ncbi:MAG: hypothetical protein FD180_4334 [Planctomycetota bacterium]|nr:MAG: hypothetical protein FD180_4334 [Planctomycetota bacterium]
MKAISLAALLALLIGIAAGAVLERDRRNRAPRESAVPAAAVAGESSSAAAGSDRISALEAEVAILTSRLSALESRPATAGPAISWPPFPAASPASADALPKIEAMRAEMAALISKRDGEGLLFLARRLAALGEAAYPSIMEIAKLLLEDEEKDPREFGDYDLDGSLFGDDAGALQAWSLAHPDLSPPAFRSRAIEKLANRSDIDVAQLFLAALRTETDADNIALLCEGISGRMRAGISEDVETAMRSLTSNEKALDSLLYGLSCLDEAAALAALKRLSAPQVPASIRERALANLTLLSPPETGYLLLGVEIGSAWHAAGIRTGDLILEANGKPPVGESFTYQTTNADGTVGVATAVSDWSSGIGEDDTVVLRVLRDGATRTVTVQGNDQRWHGSHVNKAE